MISCRNLSLGVIRNILKRTSQIIEGQFEPRHFILINAFFEPSTRTSMSFESAVYRLGGNVITFNKSVSSIQKGESFKDTIRTLSKYGDIMVLRHPEKGIVRYASDVSDIPVINAGDGSGEHPTQGLVDLYSIHEYLLYSAFHHPLTYLHNNHIEQNYDCYNFLFVGDIRYSRTIHSLLHLLVMFPPINIYLLPYEGCEPSKNMVAFIKANNHNKGYDPIVLSKYSVNWSKFNVIYVTRFQTERHKIAKIPSVVIDESVYDQMSHDCIVLHPFPRNEELSTEVDYDHRSFFFDQIENGVYVRMAIIDLLLKAMDNEF
jgi:aspartate carbamoyltransferase